jgi:hypothetical protein
VNSNSNQAQQRAEKLFKKQERAQDARQAMIEYEAHALAVREKTIRLRALRLAKGACRKRSAEYAPHRPRFRAG